MTLDERTKFLKPEIKIIDGKPIYFYTPQQIEFVTNEKKINEITRAMNSYHERKRNNKAKE